MSRTETTLAEAPIEITDGDRGKNYPTQNELLDEGYCLFLSATNVTKDGFAFDKCQFITEQKDEALRKGRVRRNDVVLTTRGTLGNVAYYSNDVPFEHVRINSGMVTIQAAQEELSSRYLYYYLKSDLFQAQVRALQSGAAQPQLPIRDIKKIKISYPDNSAQDRIADVVGAYDDLIENNRRRIALLEEAARILYREWFVHFRFPGHEHVKIVGGVPEGWERNSLFDCVDVLSGGTPKTTEPAYWGDEIPFFTPKDTGDGPYTFDTEKMITEEGLKRCNSKLYDKDTLFVTARGTVGKIRLAQRPMAMNQSCYALQSTTHLDQAFLYFGVTEQVNHMKSRAVGAVFDAIIVDTFKKIPFLLPEKSIADEFSEIAKNALRQIDVLSSQNRQLTKARDLLLPRLMDGRLEV